jgi:hypothetical protein
VTLATILWGVTAAIAFAIAGASWATEASAGDWLAVFCGQKKKPTFARLEALERKDAHARKYWAQDTEELLNARQQIDNLNTALRILPPLVPATECEVSNCDAPAQVHCGGPVCWRCYVASLVVPDEEVDLIVEAGVAAGEEP